MDDAALLEVFDRQIRRVPDATPGFRAEILLDPAPLIWVTPEVADASWGGGVFWCDLDEGNADTAIAATVEHFRPLGREFEWKYYAYDQPSDLADRLEAAGFEADDEEALVIGEVSDVLDRLAAAPEPEGITIRRLREDQEGAAADWQGINDLHRAVWHEDSTGMSTTVAAAIAADPRGTSMWLAVAEDGTVVCAARANFHAGTDFASLWGGSTLEEYRGRGIYKALVSRRAAEAAERGFRYLQVDASPDSRPILERLGLRTLTSTTPWMWRP
ncbi:MAG: GNAT family N-acetyltransferase [Spirochaetaceae bacterium]|nr:GNAT family N-acetyltransferase [Spirochaetaceae bacterium]